MARVALTLLCVFATLAPAMCLNNHVGRSFPLDNSVEDDKDASKKVVKERRGTTTPIPTTTLEPAVIASTSVPAEAEAARAYADEKLKEAEGTVQEMQGADVEAGKTAGQAEEQAAADAVSAKMVEAEEMVWKMEDVRFAVGEGKTAAAAGAEAQPVAAQEGANAKMADAAMVIQKMKDILVKQEEQSTGRQVQADQESGLQLGEVDLARNAAPEEQAGVNAAAEHRPARPSVAKTTPEPTTSTSVPFSDLTPCEKSELLADARAEADAAQAEAEEKMTEAEGAVQEMQQAGLKAAAAAGTGEAEAEAQSEADAALEEAKAKVAEAELAVSNIDDMSAQLAIEEGKAAAGAAEFEALLASMREGAGAKMADAKVAIEEMKAAISRSEDKSRGLQTQAELVQSVSARSAPLEEQAGVNDVAEQRPTKVPDIQTTPEPTTSTSVPFLDLTPCEKQEYIADARAEAYAAQAEAEEKMTDAELAVKEMQDADVRATAQSGVADEQAEAQAAADAARAEANAKVAEAEKAISNVEGMDVQLAIEEGRAAAVATEAEEQLAVMREASEARMADTKNAIKEMKAAISRQEDKSRGPPTQAASGSGARLLQASSARSDPLEKPAGSKFAEERRATTSLEPTTTVSTSVPFSELTPAEKSEQAADARAEADAAVADMEEEMQEAEDAMQEMQEADEDQSRENPIQARRATTTPEPTTAASTSAPVPDLTPVEKSEQAADAQAEADAAMADMEEDMKEAEDTIQEMQEAGGSQEDKSRGQPSQAESVQAPSARTDSESVTQVRGEKNSNAGDVTTFLQLTLDTFGSVIEPADDAARCVAE